MDCFSVDARATYEGQNDVGAPRLGAFSLRGLRASEVRRPDLFWRKVKKGPASGRSGRCWPWTRHTLPKGYGIFGVTTRVTTAHRVAYVLTHGDLEPGVVVRHTCDNPPCCNPDHLVAGAPADNVRDMDTRGRRRTAAKLSADQVAEIRDAARGWTGRKKRLYADLARKFGISPGYVPDVVTGRFCKRLDCVAAGGAQ